MTSTEANPLVTCYCPDVPVIYICPSSTSGVSVPTATSTINDTNVSSTKTPTTSTDSTTAEPSSETITTTQTTAPTTTEEGMFLFYCTFVHFFWVVAHVTVYVGREGGMEGGLNGDTHIINIFDSR
ncbi:hypothetical protein NP493_410g01009 [Ridgeia piscesae]|uniref:Uncharacterized protein n=1 Tax=Ridgeia piscesae TaxID=27915 RepID=A0AAD9L128_RIDPI|nr:hypothetical protein NP493_410g01009 [Ridgeia piscesae]